MRRVVSVRRASESGEAAPRQPGSSRRRRPRCRILIAEDEYLIAVQIETDLESAGFATIGPFTTLEAAIQASRVEQFDLALLDVNLNGNMVFPLAEELTARGLPFIFLTGYLTDDVPERFRAFPRLSKPYRSAALVETIRAALPKTGR